MRANFLKADRLLTKGFTQNLKKNNIIKEKNVKDQIRNVFSQKKHPRKYLHKTRVFKNHLIFLKKLSGLQKLYGRVFVTEAGGHFLGGFFSRCLFFLK